MTRSTIHRFVNELAPGNIFRPSAVKFSERKIIKQKFWKHCTPGGTYAAAYVYYKYACISSEHSRRGDVFVIKNNGHKSESGRGFSSRGWRMRSRTPWRKIDDTTPWKAPNNNKKKKKTVQPSSNSNKLINSTDSTAKWLNLAVSFLTYVCMYIHVYRGGVASSITIRLWSSFCKNRRQLTSCRVVCDPLDV